MRVLVASDALAGLSPREASQMIGQAFADAGAQVAVAPISGGGDSLAEAIASFRPDARVVAPLTVADVVSELGAGTVGSVVLDLTGMTQPSVAELVATVTPDVVGALRESLAGDDLVAAVLSAEVAAPLTGLTGTLAERGRATGADLADTLADDVAASAWAASLGVDGAAAGTGAAGGVGAVVLALGGRVRTGIELCIDGFGVRSVIAKADVVVTGADQLDFHARGGDVVKRVAELAGEALRPVVAVVGRNFVSSRELRLAGIEAAYPVLTGAGAESPTPDELSRTAAQVAATWRW